jgi:hypothetical protein
MNFFYLCTFSCTLLHSLLFSWVILLNFSVINGCNGSSVQFLYHNMPVITRSQSRLLRSTGSTDGLLQRTLDTTGPTDGLSLSSLPSSSVSTDSNIIVPVAPTIDSHITSVNTTPIVNSSLFDLGQSTLEFQNLEPGISNLEFSNFNFDHQYTRLVTQLLPHPSNSLIIKMEDDCEDASGMAQTSKDMIEMDRLFQTFTQQLSIHVSKLQDQLKENEERVHRKQTIFKQEMRDEFNAFHTQVLSTTPQVSSSTFVPSSDMSLSQEQVISSVTSSVDHTVPPSSTAPSLSSTASMSSPDVQTRMMLMLTESFTKLSTVLVDKQNIGGEI